MDRHVGEVGSFHRFDKKMSGGEIKFVLAKRMGEVIWGQSVPEELIRTTLNG